ncbi:MAG: hypothetical protein WBX15_13510 [Thermoanaerobaculia bacterium]
MTIGGWLFLTLSLGFVWGLCGWCFYRVIKGGAKIEQPPDSLGG